LSRFRCADFFVERRCQNQAIVEKLDGDFYTTSINVFELWFGRKETEKIFELLEWLHVLELDKKSAKLAADILRQLKSKGAIELRDLSIAAICINNDAELLSYDKHFERLKKIRPNFDEEIRGKC
jgi:predicted nucleic acid-binding protein